MTVFVAEMTDACDGHGSVRSSFLSYRAQEGYSGLLHGGVIAAIIDGAMTNCFFARGIHRLTAKWKVRYHASVAASEEVFLQAWLEDDAHGLFQSRAELKQDGAVKASASGKFMKQHE